MKKLCSANQHICDPVAMAGHVLTRVDSRANSQARESWQMINIVVGFMDMALLTDDAASGVKKMQDFCDLCKGFIFDTYFAKGSSDDGLLEQLVRLMQSNIEPADARLLPVVAYQILDPMVEPVLNSALFFTPEIQSLVTQMAQADVVQVGDELYTKGIRVVLRLAEAGETLVDVKRRMMDMLNPVRDKRMHTGVLLEKILARLLEVDKGDLLAKCGDSQYGLITPAMSIEDIANCVRAAVTAESSLEGSHPDAMAKMNSCIKHYLENCNPQSWLENFKAAETIAFFIKYLFKEDLTMAYEIFKEKNRGSPVVMELLETVENQKFADTDQLRILDMSKLQDSHSADAQQELIGDLLKPNELDDPDMRIMKEITGRWMNLMQEKVNIPMTPHHTQMITMLLCAEFYQQRDRQRRQTGARNGRDLRDLRALVAQVGTGEGKSVIIAMLAIYFVKRFGKRVHILENNESLMKRDYESNKSFFELFQNQDGRPISAACDCLDVDADISYCLTSTINSHYMRSVTDAGEGLAQMILIVDEVDNLVIDGDPTTNYVHKDTERTQYIRGCFQELQDNGARATRPAGCPDYVWQKAKSAKQTVDGWTEGKDYGLFRRGTTNQYRMMDKRGRLENTTSVPLQYLNYTTGKVSNPVWQSHYFVTCTPHIFRQYDCIFGLTGSVGGQAEKDYLLETCKFLQPVAQPLGRCV